MRLETTDSETCERDGLFKRRLIQLAAFLLELRISIIPMDNQHQTFPGEPAERPQPGTGPEISRPADPQETKIPQEDNQVIPDDFPPGETSPTPPPVEQPQPNT